MMESCLLSLATFAAIAQRFYLNFPTVDLLLLLKSTGGRRA